MMHARKVDPSAVLTQSIQCFGLEANTNVYSNRSGLLPRLKIIQDQPYKAIKLQQCRTVKNRTKANNVIPIHANNPNKENLQDHINGARFGVLSNKSHVKKLDCSLLIERDDQPRKGNNHIRKMSHQFTRRNNQSQKLIESNQQFTKGDESDEHPKKKTCVQKTCREHSIRRNKNYSCQLRKASKNADIISSIKAWDYGESGLKKSIQTFTNYTQSAQMY